MHLANRVERQLMWMEIADTRGLFDGPWVICGDFNTTRFVNERRNCRRMTRSMIEFSDFINDMEVVDPPLIGGSFTWEKGDNQQAFSRIDRFLFSTEWNDEFKNISQTLLPRVSSDHAPLLLKCGEWENHKSYFKLENWWLGVAGFSDMVKTWWLSFEVQGRPDYILACKLRMLKGKLKEWNDTNHANFEVRKT